MAVFEKIAVVSYNVSKWEEAKTFYGQTLGLPVVFASDEYGWYEYGGENLTHVAINRWLGPEPLPLGGGKVVFSVDDAQKTTAELRRLGVRCDDPQVVPGMVTYGRFFDPDGNELHFAGPPA